MINLMSTTFFLLGACPISRFYCTVSSQVQGGIFAHLLHRNEPGWHLQSTPGGASGSAREDLSPFGIRHLSGLWTAAAAGMTAALSVFVAEMRRRRKVVQARDVVELREMLG